MGGTGDSCPLARECPDRGVCLPTGNECEFYWNNEDIYTVFLEGLISGATYDLYCYAEDYATTIDCQPNSNGLSQASVYRTKWDVTMAQSLCESMMWFRIAASPMTCAGIVAAMLCSVFAVLFITKDTMKK